MNALAERADAEAESVDGVHMGSWSVNLETEPYEESAARVVEDAIAAVERTRPGFHVNLVTHGAHGHPASYLDDALDDAFGDRIDREFVDRCGCGGYVTRVHRLDGEA